MISIMQFCNGKLGIILSCQYDMFWQLLFPSVRLIVLFFTVCGVVWCGVVWCGVVWCGVVWCGVVWCGVVWRGMVWCEMVWCGVVWCGVCVRVCNVHHFIRHNIRLYAPTKH